MTATLEFKLTEPWRPMSDAPRDGTPFVAMYSDLSGGYVYAYGEDDTWWSFNGYFSEGQSEWEEEGGANALNDYAGWIPLPDDAIAKLGRGPIEREQ